MHRRGLGLVRGVPHLKNLLVRELEGAASVGDSRTASRRKKNQILGESEKFSSLNETKSLSKKSIFGCEEKIEISSPSRILDVPTKLFVSENTLILF